jgi:hypothetical protein
MSKLDDPCLSDGNGRGRHAELLPTTQAMVLESDRFVGRPQLDFEGWRTFLRSSCGNHPDVIDPSAFIGWVRPTSVCGLAAAALKIECGSTAVDFGRDAYRSERTQHDARLAEADYYYAVFQVAGRSTLSQLEEVAELAVGDVALLDAARPAACSAGDAQWLRVQLPRQSLVSNLGCEPQGGSYAHGGLPAASLLFDLVRDADKADNRRPRRPIPTCSWRSMISSARCLRRPIRCRSRAMRTGCSRVSVASSRRALPIRISALVMSQSKRGSRCATSRSSSWRTARPAANSYTRFVWIAPPTFCIAGRHWQQASH